MRRTHLCKLAISCNLSNPFYYIHSVQRVLRPLICNSRSLVFLSCFWYHIVELFTQVGAYTRTQVCSQLCQFENKIPGILVSILYILNYIMFDQFIYNLNTLISQSSIFHDQIGTYYLYLNIFNSSYFHLWNRIPQYLLISQQYSVLTPDFRLQNKSER